MNMSAAEDFPVSEMALRRAQRSAEEAALIEDPTDRLISLVFNGISSREMVERYVGDANDIFLHSNVMMYGARMVIESLLDAGLQEDQIPIDTLKERIVEVELGLSVLLESKAGDQGRNIADIYLAEDGGNG